SLAIPLLCSLSLTHSFPILRHSGIRRRPLLEFRAFHFHLEIMAMSIEFDNSSGVYAPGSEVTGSLLLSVDEPLKAKYVVVSADGEARSAWKIHESRTRQIGNTTEQWDVTVPYTAVEPYIEAFTMVWRP
ncbi:hypothetical protein PMAYCL1PPCAC_19514, partial [Pristionchus mayeri]